MAGPNTGTKIALSPSMRMKSPMARLRPRLGRLHQIEWVDHVEARVGAADGIVDADEDAGLLGLARVHVQAIERDPGLVLEDGVGDQPLDGAEQPLIDL